MITWGASTRQQDRGYVCSVITTFFRSAFGLLSPARVCFLLLSSLTLLASNIVRLSCDALCTGLGTCRVLIIPRDACEYLLYEYKTKGKTNRDILPTCGSNFHLSLRLSRYSIAARSRVSIIPSFSDALAFHKRRLPSSEPDSTKRASAVKRVEVTLNFKSRVSMMKVTRSLTSEMHRCMRFV